MRALVVYESMFGNTRDVAAAIADGLADRGVATDVVEVADAPDHLDDTLGLLVVGAPTHGFGLSRPTTRTQAAERARRQVISARTGVREWLAALAPLTVPSTTFSTRTDKPKVPGSAAKAIAKRLRHHGSPAAVPPEDFWVVDTEGPLRPGELDRAREWGRRVAAAGSGAPAVIG